MSLLKKANQLFKEGKYNKAYLIYKQLKNNEGYKFLDFNIKNCLNKMTDSEIMSLNDLEISNKSFEVMKKNNDSLFDADYYLNSNPDIKNAGVDPYQHYLEKGWKEEKRDSPSTKYDLKKYSNTYKDISRQNINPLVHYLEKGKEEGRILFLKDSYIKLINNDKKLTEFQYKEYKKRINIKKNVIYTFNFDSNLKIVNPVIINKDFDYIYFGLPGNLSNSETIWEYRPSEFYIDDLKLMIAFYCYNINILLPNYDNKIWIIHFNYLNENNLTSIYYHIKSNKSNLFIFGENSTNKQIKIHNHETIMEKEFINYHNKEVKPFYDIIYPNCLIVKKKNNNSRKVLSLWWRLSIKHKIDFCLPIYTIDCLSGYIIPEVSARLNYMFNLDYKNILKSTYGNLIKYRLPLNKYRDDFTKVKVNVIVPVYNALEDVKKCLYSIETSSYENYNIIIADDCSDMNVQEWLQNYVEDKKHIHLLSSQKNQGYTINVNNAIKKTQADYVILLNSDTLVHGNWIEKLLIPFFEDSSVGVTGALSGAAGWQSVPYLKGENTLPKHIDIKSINEYLEKNSLHPYYPMSDIINGFCMCIKRETIVQVGLFDESAFPKGYGEEDDFCIRARNNGFKNVIVTSVYVHHSKSKSFGHSTRIKLATESRKILDFKYGKDAYKLLTESIGINPAINSKREDIQKFFELYRTRYSILDEKIAQVDTIKKYPKIKLKICVHLHLYYLDMVDFFTYYLENLPYKFDLYITVNDNIDFKIIENKFKKNININFIKFALYENRGRDIFPFLDTIGKVYNQYDFVLHIHSKKSIHNHLGSKWLSHLMSHLLYNKTYTQNLLFIMQSENIGLLFPPVIEDLYPNYKWGKNKNITFNLLKSIGADSSLNEKLIFPAGNMFWANTNSLKKLFDYKMNKEDFPIEPIETDGTLAHSLERALNFIVKDMGYTSLIVEPKEKVEFATEFEMFEKRTIKNDNLEKTIIEKIHKKEAFSLVRFYDGEGAFYKCEKWSTKYLQERMKYYFGEKNYSKKDALVIKNFIIDSLNNADIVGIPNLEIVKEMMEFTKIYANNDIEKLPFIRRRYNQTVDCTSAWRIISSFELVITALSSNKVFCTKDVHYDMVLKGIIYRVLNEVSQVNIITSQPLKKYLSKLFDIKVNQYDIPSRSLDNEKSNYTKHYPNVFNQIITRLKKQNLKGELFLVGAGPLGKAYCDEIKRQGGIALDMGAVFDSWINFHTRPEHLSNKGFDKNLLLTSDNILKLTNGKIIPKADIFENDLPKYKINKHLK